LFAQDQLLNGLSGPNNSWSNCWCINWYDEVGQISRSLIALCIWASK